jgi:hypothetical protein
MIGVRAYGVPSRQELLLFDELVIVDPGAPRSRTAAELRWLEERRLLKCLTPASLVNAAPDLQIDRTLIIEECSRNIIEECQLFCGDIPGRQLDTIFESFLRPHGEYIDHPSNDPWYNDATRIMAAVLRHAHATDAVGILDEDRSALTGYSGYRLRVPFTDSGRLRLPEELRTLLPEETEEPGGTAL